MDEHLIPEKSPAYFDKPHPLENIKRMSKLPLVFVGIILIASIGALAYAAHQRSNKTRHVLDEKSEVIKPSNNMQGANNLLNNYEGEGTISPKLIDDEPPGKNEETAPVLQELPAVKSNPAPPLSPVLSKEEKNRQERATKFREDLFYDAVVASTTVSVKELREENDTLATNQTGTGLSKLVNLTQGLLENGKLSGQGTIPTLAGLEELGDQNLRGHKDEFKETERKYGYSTEFRKSQLTPYEIRVGTVIPAVMISGINSDLPGEIIAQVSQNVRDTRTGRYILVPQGSKLVGSYDHYVAMGQERAMVGWHRVQFPDGSVLELGNMGGVDPSGYAGFTDQVNNHYWKIFGNAALLSVIGAGAQLSQPDRNYSSPYGNTSASQELAAELGRQWGQVGQEMTRRNLNIQPTLEIRPGYKFNVMVNKDLILNPYRDLPVGR